MDDILSPEAEVGTEGDASSITVLRYRFHLPRVNGGARMQRYDPGEGLRRHLDMLERWGYTLISFGDYRLFRSGELHLPRRPVILTFDDADDALAASPVLAELGGRGVVYVKTHQEERADRAEYLGALQASGFEIGALPYSGRALMGLPPEETESELRRSREFLEQLLHTPIHSFAYPADAVTSDIKRLAKKAGYAFGVTGAAGERIFGSDVFNIRRHTIANDASSVMLFWRLFAPRVRTATAAASSINRFLKGGNGNVAQQDL
jgi:peptidoglycan/xylan/chitin deacetylase (PgdA/CDA1 family)